MDYRKYGDSYYIRADRNDKLIATILDVCRREGIRSATFSGIGGCKEAQIEVFDAGKGTFECERVEGLLELVCLTGNVIEDAQGEPAFHAHALFAYRDDAGQQRIAAGHLKETTVLYTAEIELRPIVGGTIKGERNLETGTDFWSFAD